MTDDSNSWSYDGESIRGTVMDDAFGDSAHLQVGGHTLVISPLEDGNHGFDIRIADHGSMTLSGPVRQHPVLSIGSGEYPTTIRIHDTHDPFY